MPKQPQGVDVVDAMWMRCQKQLQGVDDAHAMGLSGHSNSKGLTLCMLWDERQKQLQGVDVCVIVRAFTSHQHDRPSASVLLPMHAYHDLLEFVRPSAQMQALDQPFAVASPLPVVSVLYLVPPPGCERIVPCELRALQSQVGMAYEEARDHGGVESLP